MKHKNMLANAIVSAAIAALPLFAAFGFTLEGTFTGATRYVSKSGSDSNGGTSWDDAKQTIQAAVDLCASGDTVVVDDGEYSDTTQWTSASDNAKTLPTVVQITKRIHLVSRNGKHKTHIVGRWADTATGVGTGAARCIYINGTASANDAANGTLIEGFTIRDGATEYATADNNDYDSAGGICGGTGANGKGLAYVVDCDIVNCRAGTGAAISRGIVPIRCAFVGNRGVQGTNNQHVFYRTLYAYNCVFAMNGPAARTVGTNGGSIFAQTQAATIVNCTFIDNTCYTLQPNGDYKSPIYNCAFLGDGEALSYGKGGHKAYIYPTNCVQTASGTDIGGRIAEEGATAGCKVGVSEFQHWYAADTREWKSAVNGDLKDAGFNARSVAATFVPEEYLDTDFFGKARNWTSVDIGAIEAQGEAADPALGTIQLGTNVAVMAGTDVVSLPRGFVSCEAATAQVRLVPTIGDATPLFGYAVSGEWGSFYRYPDLGADRGAWMTPPASGKAVTVDAKVAADETWVDGSYAGGDSDGSETKPYTTIQDAVGNTAPYGLVHVAPGTYATGGTTLSGHKVVSRVGIENQVAIRADGSAEDTIIRGDADTRCVAVRRQAVTVHLQGFTLENGTADKGALDADGLGGGFYATPQSWTDGAGLDIGYQRNAQVTDCIFTGNSARQGAAMCGGWAQRCVFYDNVATANNRVTSTQTGNDYQRGAVAFKSVLSACVVRDNLQTRTDTVSSLYKCHPYNVSFAETNYTAGVTSGNPDYRPVDRNTPAYNCAFMGGYLDDHNDSVTIVPVGNVGDTTLQSKSWLARYDRDELFVDPDKGDLHLRSTTDAASKGAATAYRAAMFAVGDIEGDALGYIDGNPVPGAYSTVLEGRDLYVDAVNGSDDADGRTAAAAKKTLAAALALAHTGDTVHAAPGDYADGTMTYSGGTVLIAPTNGVHSASRGVVPKGVSLVADEGPAVTFITGAIDNLNGNGLGDTAVRCLTALAGSKVAGFTLRGGSTFNTTGDMRDENMGGLALAPSCRHGETGSAVFENCVFTNGFARTAGDVAGGILRRCRLYGGKVSSGAAISMYSRFEHCLLVNESDDDTGVRFCGGMRSCTYVNKQGKASGQNVELGNSLFEYGATFENSVIATVNSYGGDLHPVLENMTNCLWVVGGENAKLDLATCANVKTVALVDDALAMLDAAYAPLAGSDLVDAGDRALLAKLSGDVSTDLAGGQRIYGGALDIGAFEYDLLQDLAMTLHHRVGVVNVASAGEEIALADGKIRIPAGAIDAGVSVNRESGFAFSAEVTGTGTLSIYIGDMETPWRTLTAADGETELRFRVAAGTTALRFAYVPGASDADGASIGAFVGTNGLLLIIK